MDFVRKALRRNGGIISRAARELGISRVNLYELMERYNIRIQEFKTIKAGAQSSISTREIS
jgi:DNA-binding NtrC family response regulator